MVEISGSRTKKSNLPAGTLVHTGEKKVPETKIKLIDYGKKEFIEKDMEEVSQCFPYKDERTISWINIDGLHDIKILEELGECFGFHPLILENILNTGQRPKIEVMDKYIYVVLKMIDTDPKATELTIEQVSIIFGKNFVISFQEKPLDIYKPIRKMLKNDKALARKQGSDFIAYLLIDAIVDNYYKVCEVIGERIEKFENKIILNPTQKTLGAIYKLKKDMLFIRKSIWPLREVIAALERGTSSLIKPHTKLYLRDVYDHVIQVIDTVETYREMLSEMIEIYLSSMSNKLNEIMKVLTIFSAVFIPLTFVASIYGMNFRLMPELSWKYGYLVVWIVIIAISIFLISYFKRKKWF